LQGYFREKKPRILEFVREIKNNSEDDLVIRQVFSKVV